MAKNEEAGTIRHRFSVPAADTVVEEWIAAQSNLGFSLRVLINTFVSQFGMQDATCVGMGMTVNKKGRPSKEAARRIQSMFTEDDMEPDVVQDTAASAAPVRDVKAAQERVPAARQPFARSLANGNSADIMGMLGSTNVTKAVDAVPGAEKYGLEEDSGNFVDPDDLF